MAAGDPASVYYRELRLANVKAFIPGTRLDLCIDGQPAPWTLILGENGLGKTTLLQCLALLRPTLNVEQSDRTTARSPDRVEPALPAYSDELLVELARVGEATKVQLEADFVIGRPLRAEKPPGGRAQSVSTSAIYQLKQRELANFDFSQKQRRKFVQPLLVAYSAARHAPYARADVITDADPTASLFNPEIELVDAVQVLEDLDHLSLRKDARASTLYGSIKQALAQILPEVEEPDRIHVHGPALPGRTGAPTGIWIETYSGEVPLASLSVGYQTMFAWTVDLAWRMAEHHKDSPEPLREPAIVLIDELDLHLHPKWQRRVRRDLSAVFPQVQFIVTTHSPVLAQTYLDTNIQIVEREGDHAKIENAPKVVRSWRLDQVSQSLLHDLDPYSPEIVDAFRVRRELLGKSNPTAAERQALAEANAVVAGIPSEEDPEDQAAMDLIREAAHLLLTRAK